MKKLAGLALALILTSSLSACMVVPPYDAYGGPGVTVVAPLPYYHGGPHRHPQLRHHNRRWR